ncbi:putative palmitoyltransferase ZDHHC13 [Gadus morhua]|uniref:Palmitoyltransferase n=1 Tax=Gadus morhua TaxID=8049 RepID=A0A8C5CXW1_GADMO|nr:palmitoyltransferase ZDHHC13 [Gadus morhua]
MDWNEDKNGHNHGGECGHSHGRGHSHSHGPRMPGYGPPFPGMNFPGQFGKSSDPTMINTAPRSHMDESSNWDIVKATQFGVLDRCKELVEAGYDVRQPDKENVTLLHWAAINNRSDLVKYYMSKGAIVDQLGGDLSSTPLQWAIRQGHLPMVIELLRHGADPSIADGEGYRSLHLAILYQHLAVAAYLMAKGQEVDSPDCNGQTPLMLAAQKIIGPEPTNFLIKNNASLSSVDKVNRNTALHCAVLAGNVDAADVLLEAGASVDAENINGHTPIDLARQVHSPLLVQMLDHVKQERIRSNSRCVRMLSKYRSFMQLVFCVGLLGCVGAIADLNTDSWLLKGALLAGLIGAVNLMCRKLPNSAFSAGLPPAALLASIFWFLVTWFLWFLPDGASATVQALFTLNTASLLYFYLRTCRTDPGVVRATEEEKKMNVLMLAEAGFLDPRIFCTSCMIKKPMRANHCFSCDACVAKQDHHSIWTNNCIGARNHRFFVLFVAAMVAMGAWVFYGCLTYWSKHCSLNYQEQGVWGVLTALVSCSPWVLIVFCMAFYHTAWTSVILLLQLHQIAFLGLTTAERINLMHHQKKHPKSSMRQNPYNMGIVRNLASFFQLRCCGLFKPPVTDWTQQGPFGRDLARFGPPDTV